MLSKQEIRDIIGKNIRNDTFLMMEWICKGKSYVDCCDYINDNREELGIKQEMSLAKEKTVLNYLNSILSYLTKEEQERVKKEVKGKEEKIEGGNNNIKKKSGVYGIYIDDELVYIGQTCNSFGSRFSTHKSNLKTSGSYLYRTLREAKKAGKSISLQPLIVKEDLFVEKEVRNRDIKAMELGLISLYQPKCNIEGKLTPYKL